MTSYQHTQTATAIVAVIGLIQAGTVVSFVFLKYNPAFILLLVGFTFIELLFFQFTVTVDQATVDLKYGIGLIKKTIFLREIKAITIIRNLAMYGWAIRYVGAGQLFNIPGLDAVELRLASNQRVRIGTNDARGLAAAIQTELQKIPRHTA